MRIGVTCPKCGLMQFSAPKCRSCGTPLPHAGPAVRPGAPEPTPPSPSQARPPEPPPIKTTEPIPHGRARHRVTFEGSAWTLLGISIVNMLLTVVTLGVYSFWAKTRTRRYLIGQTAFDQDRFAYHGTATELLRGWIKAALVFGLPFLLARFLKNTGWLGWGGDIVVGVLLFAVGLVFAAVATVGARRYRLSRTSWREIRFSFRGHAWDFIRLFVKGVLLSLITLGLYYPFFEVKRQEFLISQSFFGSEPFRFGGAGKDLFLTYVIGGLLLVPTLGLSWFWISAKRQRYIWNHTRIADAQFECTVTGPGLFWLTCGNMIILLFTLAFGWPWTRLRSLRYMASHLTLNGSIDFDAIRQEADEVTATGDALAGFLDVGFDLG